MRVQHTIGAALSLVAIALWVAGAVPAQEGKKLPNPRDVVTPKVTVLQPRGERGRVYEVVVEAEILKGFHTNSNRPLEEYLIPMTLKAEAPAGVRVTGVEYPKGEMKKFAFSEKELSVYEGTVRMVMKIEAGAGAKGKTEIPVALRYQACNEEVCLPPVTKQVKVELDLGA